MKSITSIDELRAHALGIAASPDEERLRSLTSERDTATQMALKLSLSLEEMRRQRDVWRERWRWTFGALLLVAMAKTISVLGEILPPG